MRNLNKSTAAVETVGLVDGNSNKVETTTTPSGIWTRVNGIIADMGLPVIINGATIKPKLFPYLYCLNDIHRASGYSRTHEPAQWLRHNDVKMLISILEQYSIESISKLSKDSDDIPVHLEVKHGGVHKGSYGSILVVFYYASWLDQNFAIEIYSSYINSMLRVNSKALILPIEISHDTSLVVPEDGTLSVGDWAKIISTQHGVSVGRNKLMSTLRQMEFLMHGHGTQDPDRNAPYQKWITGGYFSTKLFKTKAGGYVLQPRLTTRGIAELTPHVVGYLTPTPEE